MLALGFGCIRGVEQRNAVIKLGGRYLTAMIKDHFSPKEEAGSTDIDNRFMTYGKVAHLFAGIIVSELLAQ